MRTLFVALTALAAFGIGAAPALADEVEAEVKTATKQEGGKVITTPVFKAATIKGMNVKNPLDETVGEIDELVIDIRDGKIRYAALSVGGFLGVGDKLFAVPWESLKLKHGEEDNFFVLDVDKEKLQNAPGFDKDNWPDVANPKFGEEIDRYYGVDRTATRKKERNVQ